MDMLRAHWHKPLLNSPNYSPHLYFAKGHLTRTWGASAGSRTPFIYLTNYSSNWISLSLECWYSINRCQSQYTVSLFPKLSSMDKQLKFFTFIIFTGQKTKRKFVAHRDYPSIACCRTKRPAILRATFGLFQGILKCLCIYCTVSHGTHNDVLRNPVW